MLQTMIKGFWIWPESPDEQDNIVHRINGSPQLATTLKLLAKSKDGLSNAEIDEITGNNSQWLTLWVLRQLLSLGLIEYKVDPFGGPAKYTLSERGKDIVKRIT